MLNEKIPFYYVFAVFAAGLVLGFAAGALGAGISWTGKRPDSGESAERKQRLEQVNRDLGAAIDSQREAAERASRLQTELQGVTEHARNLEEGTRRLEARAGGLETRTGTLAEQLDGIIDQSGELADGINRASGNLEESRILLDELGAILRNLPGNG